MKKGLLYVGLAVVAIVLVIVIWQPWIAKIAIGEGMLLKKTELYKVYNEKREPINASFFLKKRNSRGDKVNEIVVKFNDMNIGSRYLILIPDSSWIGRPNQSNKDYKLIFNSWLYQSEVGAKFKIINDPVWMDIYGLIKHSNFGKDTIRFDTFDELRSIGKEIIITE